MPWLCWGHSLRTSFFAVICILHVVVWELIFGRIRKEANESKAGGFAFIYVKRMVQHAAKPSMHGPHEQALQHAFDTLMTVPSGVADAKLGRQLCADSASIQQSLAAIVYSFACPLL